MNKKIYDSKMNVLSILNKIGNSEFYFGIEIEVEFNSNDERNKFVDKFYDNFTDFLLKKEMSILCGLEIVSSPMTYEILIDKLQDIILFCNNNNAMCSERTGLHIHVSKTILSDDIKIFQFINNPINREEIIGFSGRLSPYARYTTRNFPKNKSARGYSVNLLNPNTVEFRIFELKLDFEWITGCLMFCNLVKKNINSLKKYNDLIQLSKLENYPKYFIDRLENVSATPKDKKYPIIYPISDYMQYW